jgi:FMN phosphatase YigB (HAD superfamily)
VDKVIVTDVDGVLLNQPLAFEQWMDNLGYELKNPNEYYLRDKYELENTHARKLVKQFGSSEAQRCMPALRDSVEYVHRLHNDGYVFHVVTSQTDDPAANQMRIENLTNLFGNVFEDYTFLDCGADKEQALAQYADSDYWWIEDKPKNANDGAAVGMRAILLHHEHNADTDGNYVRANNWKEIYEIITKT